MSVALWLPAAALLAAGCAAPRPDPGPGGGGPGTTAYTASESEELPADPPASAEPLEHEEAAVAAAGDTLERLAMTRYGRAYLWRHLMEWNKLETFGPADPLSPGTTVLMPQRFAVLAAPDSPAATRKEATAPPARARRPARARPPRWAFKPGELLEFDVKWFFVTAGQATMRVAEPAVVGGRRCYHFVATAKSKLVFFFKVDDVVESWSTEDALLPVRYEKHLREGNYKKDEVAHFDRDALTATWGSSAAVPLGAACFDLLVSFYKLRTLAFPPPGGSVEMCTHTNKKNYDVTISVVRRERVKTPAGTFDAIVVKPKLKFEGLFRQKGDVDIWLTDDAARIPVLVKSHVFLLGSVDIVLVRKTTP